jgi:EAL domain-containing protein (putative c-di-GMP-specific phosphodiesterase class I)
LLQIELTESIMLSGAERAAETMNRLRGLGVSLAIDDFGTGYSCLSYLPRLPFNTLKIDRSFVHELESRSGAEAIVRSLVTLAHSLEMQVIVEGIESMAQLEIVKKLGGDEVQGFLLGRPTPDPVSQLRTEEGAMKFDTDSLRGPEGTRNPAKVKSTGDKGMVQ